MTMGTTSDRDQALVGDALPAAAGMKAVVARRYGPPEVLEYTDVGRPVVGDGDVLVSVRAASVHPGDYFVMTGVPQIVRLAFGLRRPRHPIPGRDLAGVVEAVGKDVPDLQPGDEVFGWSTTGALAQYASVPADQLVRKPDRLTMEQAASVPTSGITALQALRDIAHVQPGHTVLVTGASGGVGTFAVQIAKLFGAEVTGVCSTRNVELVRALGAAHVIDYTRTDFTQAGRRYDVILDNVEAQPLQAVRNALTPTGTLIPNSGRGGRRVGPLGRFVKARVRSLVTRQTLKPFTSVQKRQDLRTLTDWLEAGGAHPGHRPHLPTERSSRRPPLRRSRPHPRQGRDHRLNVGPGVTTHPSATRTPATAVRRTAHQPNEGANHQRHDPVPINSALTGPPIPVQAKIAAAWTSFMFLYIYVDFFNLYKPGVVDGILNGLVWKFDVSPTLLTIMLASVRSRP